MKRKKLPSRQRCWQVHRWLQRTYPVKGGTRIRVARKMPSEFRNCDGVIVFDVSPPLIWINGLRSRSTMIYALLHEYAHALLHDRHRDWKSIEHSDSFYRIYGVLERHWVEGGGEGESLDF